MKNFYYILEKCKNIINHNLGIVIITNVCVDEIGNLRKPDYVSHKFKQILRKNNLREIRFHDLRHSCATLLVKKGISLREIQDWLGHSSSRTTERYAHLDSSSKIKSASAIEKALSFSTNTENKKIKKIY